MRTLNKALIIITAFVAVLFMACEKEPIDIIEPVKPINVEPEQKSENALIKSAGKMSNEGLTMECITISYPFGFVSESGTTTKINNKEEVQKALSNEKNPVIDFVYPIKVKLYEREALVSVNNVEDLAQVFIGCIPTDGWEDIQNVGFPAFEFDGLCKELAYPVNLQSDRNTVIKVENEREFANELAKGNYYFKFPVTLVGIDGKTIAADNEKVLINTLFDCETYTTSDASTSPFDFATCYDIFYPVILTDELGNTVTVNNVDELYELLFSGEVVDFVYPITLVSEEETTIVVNNEEELTTLIEECFNATEPEPNPPVDTEICFVIDYPIQMTDTLGNETTVNNDEELLYPINPFAFIFPITITDQEGEIITVNNPTEMSYVLEECTWNMPIVEPDSVECFLVYYPVQMIDTMGNIITINTEDELCFPCSLDFIYPITIMLENETDISINNRDEIMSIWEECQPDTPIEEPPTNSELCFAIDYPVEMVDSSGMVLTINNDDEFIIPNELIDFIYPFSITLDDGTYTNIDNQCEAFSMLAMCDGIDDVPVVDFPLNYSDCFSIGFPVQTIDAYGSTNTAYNDNELNSLVLSSECVDLIYPVTITRLDNGNTFDVNTFYHLSSIANGCTNNPPVNNVDLCFTVHYPVEMIDSSGMVITINNDNEFIAPNELFDFIYPITITDQQGIIISINNRTEVAYILEECSWNMPIDPNPDPPIGTPNFYCLTIDYPVQMVDIAGNSYMANNEDEIPQTSVVFNFIYPFEVSHADGSNTTIDHLSELLQVLKTCSEADFLPTTKFPYNPPYRDYSIYFAIDFPVQTIDVLGNTNIANNEEELNSIVLSGELVDLIYPITMSRKDNNETFRVHNSLELNRLVSFIIDNPLCFVFELPVQAIDISGTVTTYNPANYHWLLHYLENDEIADFVYPVNIGFADAPTQTINSFEEYENAVDDCQ